MTVWHRGKKFKALMEAFWFRLSAEGNKQDDLLSNIKFTSLSELLKYIRVRREPKFFISPSRKDSYPKLFSDIYKADILTKADEIIKHRFKILGQIVYFEDKIDWHIDVKVGYRWPLKYFKRLLPVFNTTDNTDAKIPYELSRFHQLNILGITYWITKDEKYTKEFLSEIESWLNENPYSFGVNWTCTMDVAIRACNWLLAWEFFKDSSLISDEFIIKFLKSLLQHGRYIGKNLEYSETLTSNHYLSDIVGLIFSAVISPEFKKAEKWRAFAIKELRKEMKKQVYPDGCDFEASTCYHRLVLELFFYSTYITVINDKDFNDENYKKITEKIFGKEYTDKLYKMFDAVCYLLKPNGKMPQIGDNDSGQLFKLYPRDVLDMRYLLALGAVFFKESKWKIKEFFNSEEDIAEVLIVYDGKGKEIWNSLQWNSLNYIKSKAFPDAGWYVMRDNKNYCIVCCGLNGQNGNGGHAHNDQLGFELNISGKDFIIDPGTFVYTADYKLRNLFRSTSMHNTLQVGNLEQNIFEEKELFRINNETKAQLINFNNNYFKGRHYGYKDKAGIIAEREVKLEDKKIIINDFVIKDNKNLKYKNFIRFHLDKNVEIEKKLDCLILTNEKIKIKLFNLQKNEYNIEKSWVSKEYGIKEETKIINCEIKDSIINTIIEIV